MKLVITDTNGEQLTIATNGKNDAQRGTNLAQADSGSAKQTEQKPQEPTPAADGDKKTDQKPQESAPAADGAKQAEQKPREPANAAHPSPPDAKLPPDAANKKTEQKSPDSKAAPPKDAPHSRRKIVLAAVAFVALAASAYIIWRVFFAKPKLPDSIVTLSGRIEGDDSAIAAKSTGRILEIRFREGDAVKAGDVIAILSDEQVRAREGQAQAGVSIMEGKSKSALDQIAVLQKQMQQNELQTAQSKIDAEGRVRQAEAEVAAAEADLAQQQASYQIAAFDRDAYTKLAGTGAASERQAKQAIATADAQAAVVSATGRRVEAARGALTTAQANLENPGIREDQVAMTRRQIIGQQSEVCECPGRHRASPWAIAGGPGKPAGSGGSGSLYRRGSDAGGRAGRGCDCWNCPSHNGGSHQGVPTRLRTGRSNWQGQARTTRARVSGFQHEAAHRCLGGPHRSSGHVHA